MNKSELEHVWHSVTSALEKEFWTRGWLSPQDDRIETLEAALRAAMPLVEAAAALDPEPWTGASQRLVDQLRTALAPEQDK